MQLRLLEYKPWNAVHLSRKMFDEAADDVPCCGRKKATDGEPLIMCIDSSTYYPAFLCQTCFRKIEMEVIEFSSRHEDARPWIRTYLPVRTMADYLEQDLADVEILEMIILPERSRFARAVFSIRLGPFEFHECMILGDVYVDPTHWSVSLPGKRSGDTRRSKWRSVVKIVDDDLMSFIKVIALGAYIKTAAGYTYTASQELRTMGAEFSLDE